MPTVDKNMAELLGLITQQTNAAPPAQGQRAPPSVHHAPAVSPPTAVAPTAPSHDAHRQSRTAVQPQTLLQTQQMQQQHHRQRPLIQDQSVHTAPTAAAPQVNPSTNVNSNLNDLMNLIGTSASAPPVVAGTPSIGNPPAPRAGSIPKAPNLNHRNAAIRASHPVNTASLGSASRVGPTPPNLRTSTSNDITKDLDREIDRTATTALKHTSPLAQAASNVVRSSHAAYASNPAQAAQLAAAQRQAEAQRSKLAMTANGVSAGAVSARRPNTQVTQEQVVVGHFCRHAIKTLGRVMEGKPDKAAKEEELKAEIKSLWTQWVRGMISKTVLRQRVSVFVRMSTPEAQSIDVTGEFKQWYQHQLELQSHAASVAQARSRTTADTAAALASRSSAMQAQLAVARNPALAAAQGGSARPGTGPSGAHQNLALAAGPGSAVGPGAQRHPLPSGLQPADATVGMKRPLPVSTTAAAPGAQSLPGRQANALSAHIPAAAAAGTSLSTSTPGQPAAKKPRVPASKKKATKGSLAPSPNSQTAAKQVSGAKLQTPAPVNTTAPGQSAVTKTSEVPKKAVRKVDDELDIVRNIVDIEGEEDMLVGSENAGGAAVDTADYDAAGLILTGPALKTKLGAICTRLGLEENVPSETMEIVALAARQRLAHVLEELGRIAKARTGADIGNWTTKPCGIDQRARMQELRDQEQRVLDAALSVRREKAASAAAKLAAENTAEVEKAAKEAAASADAKKKELALKEKHEMAQRTQRNALSGVLAGIGKKNRSKGQGSFSRKQSAKVSSGGQGDISKDLASPSAGVAPAKSLSTTGDGDAKGGSKPALGSNATSGGDDVGLASAIARPSGTVANPRPPITLRDFLHFMEGEPRMRKSSIIYVLYTKLGNEKLDAQ